MTENSLNLMANALDAYIKSTSISQNSLAQKIGIAPSYISHALKRNWDNIPAGGKRKTTFSESIAKKILIFLGVDNKIVDVDNFIIATNVLYEAKEYQEHRIIDGEKGTGKTTALREFQRNSPNETFLLTCSEDMNPKAFVVELANLVGSETSGDRRKIRFGIEKKIKSMSQPVILIDEAENLKPATYGSIKAIYDSVYEYCGIVLCGANNYLEVLRKRAMTGKGCFPQIYSRFSADPGFLSNMSKDDVKTFCAHHNIYDKETINTLAHRCSDFRELDRTIRRKIKNDKIKAA
jgi:DNA transposition AAA+ family ATPase